MKLVKWLMPLGMLSAVVYVAHVLIGQMLWQEYDWMTTDISSLTATGAPNADLLRVLTTIYGLCFVAFTAGMVLKSYKEYHSVTRIGYIIFLIMALTATVGYALFPLTGDKTEMSFQNMMHVVVTVIVVFTTITSFVLMAIGHIKTDEQKPLGAICLAMALLTTVLGATNPIGIVNGWNTLGLTERLVIYPLQAFVFFLSFVHTFNAKPLQNR